jgi:hypothetical protein
MSDLESYSRRLRAVREAFAAIPLLGPGEPGALDESTGERWDRSNVLGHLAEMLPYWTSQIRAVIGGAGEVGRGEAGYARRRQGIDSGHVQTEEALRSEIDAGIEGLAQMLAQMREEDLDRPVLYRTRDGERGIDLREVLEILLVGHLEDHLRQLQELTAQ